MGQVVSEGGWPLSKCASCLFACLFSFFCVCLFPFAFPFIFPFPFSLKCLCFFPFFFDLKMNNFLIRFSSFHLVPFSPPLSLFPFPSPFSVPISHQLPPLFVSPYPHPVPYTPFAFHYPPCGFCNLRTTHHTEICTMYSALSCTLPQQPRTEPLASLAQFDTPILQVYLAQCLSCRCGVKGRALLTGSRPRHWHPAEGKLSRTSQWWRAAQPREARDLLARVSSAGVHFNHHLKRCLQEGSSKADVPSKKLLLDGFHQMKIQMLFVSIPGLRNMWRVLPNARAWPQSALAGPCTQET